MRVAASIFFAVVMLAAVGVITRERSEWHPPSEETLGNTAVSVRIARSEARGSDAEASAARAFGADTIAPALTGRSAGALMPSNASTLP